MNKKDCKRIREIFSKEREMKVNYAGYCALDKIGCDNIDELAFFNDAIESTFWEIDRLYELEKKILGEL